MLIILAAGEICVFAFLQAEVSHTEGGVGHLASVWLLPASGRWMTAVLFLFALIDYTLYIFNPYFVLSKNAAYFTSLVEFFCRTFIAL